MRQNIRVPFFLRVFCCFCFEQSTVSLSLSIPLPRFPATRVAFLMRNAKSVIYESGNSGGNDDDSDFFFTLSAHCIDALREFLIDLGRSSHDNDFFFSHFFCTLC